MVLHVCDVCRLIDNDTVVKQCNYCKGCDAWICRAHENDWITRLRAARRRVKESGFKGDPLYVSELMRKLGLKIVNIALMRDQIESGAQRLNGG